MLGGGAGREAAMALERPSAVLRGKGGPSRVWVWRSGQWSARSLQSGSISMGLASTGGPWRG